MSATDSARPPNRLAGESSPYLLQHAFNPVDWYPWGEEAFAAAREQEKPIFLSVGYSACHWCHVMEYESFENEAIADFLNRHFISIKVDREERPDVDQIYMTAVQLISQRGGWPMSVFMTPAGRPFFGGTYWPPTSRMGMPGFGDILQRLTHIWEHQREEALSAAERLVDGIQQVSNQGHGAAPLDESMLQTAMRQLLSSADRQYGGFGSAPKFPHPMDIRLLLRCARRFQDADALAVARLTLDQMAMGGLYDHLGGGFHRYSTDAIWLVPHFEKMLYDNALLVPAYLEAWQLTAPADAGSQNRYADGLTPAEYARVVRETLDYVLREMTHPQGGFYSTQDADSEGEEGKFFVWQRDEVMSLLGPDDGAVFCAAYDVQTRGNWEGHTILNRPSSLRQTGMELRRDLGELEAQLARSRELLLDARSQRVAPGRDDKILCSWNGLMISAMAQAGRALNEPRYTTAAQRAAEFVLEHLRTPDGRLRHGFKDGQARLAAYLDDYACLIDGLVELYQSTFAPCWLEEALALAEQLQQHFVAPDGGYFYTADDHEQLITRTRDFQDNATPSGNSMAAFALLRLGRLTGRSDVEEAGYNTLVAMSGLLAEHPRAASQAALALDFQLGPSHEVVIVDGPIQTTGDEFTTLAAKLFLPRTLLLRRPPDVSDEALPTCLQSHLKGREPTAQTAFYVCQQGTCQLPVSAVAEALTELVNAR
ncbi:MAG: thioredoxin domain-containing protein [Planctomycetaceae bacterium]